MGNGIPAVGPGNTWRVTVRRSLTGDFFFLILKKIHFIYLFLAALGLHCCVRGFSSCSNWGLFFVAVCRLLFAVASLVAEHGL